MGASEYIKLIKDIRLDLLDLLGSGYVIEHCVSAFLDFQRSELFEFYVTECLRVMSESLAGGERRYMTAKYGDLVNTKDTPEETRTADEIISGISDKLEKLGGGGEDIA